jgi:hypothetical protein
MESGGVIPWVRESDRKSEGLVAAGQQALAQTPAEPYGQLNNPVVAQQSQDIPHTVVHRRAATTIVKVHVDL